MRDALESLVAYEEPGTVVLVDDDRADRRLAETATPAGFGERVVSLPNPRGTRGRGVHDGSTTGTLAGLRWLAQHCPGEAVLRLDSDSLVIAPFAEKVHVAIVPGVALIGSYETAPMRTPRDFTPWEAAFRKLERPVWGFRRPVPGTRPLRSALWGPERRVRGQIRAALANGWQRGENCLAAACVVTAEFLERALAAGYLEPLDWLGTWCTDDVVLGVQARALGMRLRGMTDPGEPFAIAQGRLPGPPEWLVEQGHSIVHPVKAEAGVDEEAVRSYFRARRAAPA